MIVKCENGHWYDTNVNTVCPHCERENGKLNLFLDDVEEDNHTVSFLETDLSLAREIDTILDEPIHNLDDNIFDITSLDDDKTVSFGMSETRQLPPVAGWLVRMTGESQGKDYRLHAGKNFVGRGTTMDVVIPDDKSVTRDKHCSVVYEPKKNIFFVVHENGNLTYVNGEILDTPTEIQEGDQITIGDTTLMFIPFCKEGRTWEKE